MHTYLNTLAKNVNILESIFKQLDPIQYGAYNVKTKTFTNKIDDTNYKDLKLLTPAETLKYKYGTCYEQSILTAYMAAQHHLEYNCSYFLNIGGNTHLTCSINYQGKWYWLEHAWYKRRKIYGPFNNLNDAKALMCSYWYEEHQHPIILYIDNFSVDKFFRGKHMNSEITDCYAKKHLDAINYYNDNQVDDIKMDKNHIATNIVLKDGTSIKMQ